MKFASFPGLYSYLAVSAMLRFLGQEFPPLPPLNQEMLNWGALKAPEYACLPFKVFLGFAKQLAESGVNNVFVYNIRDIRACRYNDFCFGLEKIIQQNGHPDFKIHYWGGWGVARSFKQLAQATGEKAKSKLIAAALLYLKTLSLTDKINDLANEARPFAVNRGEIDRWLENCLKKMAEINSYGKVKILKKEFLKQLAKIKLDKKRPVIKVALAGDLFKIHEPFLHLDSIKKLNALGLLAKQPQAFSLLVFGNLRLPSGNHYREKYAAYQKKAKKYLQAIPGSFLDIGLGEVIEQLENGAKGIVHFQSFGCMPDIILKPLLARVAKDYGAPIMHFMHDTQTSDTAYQTRLEAFAEMLKRKEKIYD